MIPRSAIVVVAALATGQSSPTWADTYGDMLILQATARTAAELAAGNHCAGMELRPLIDAARGFLEAMPPGDGSAPAGLHEETLNLLRTIRYDPLPCDAPCPEAVDVAGAVPEAPIDVAAFTFALDAVVDRWLDWAESDPPRLSLATSRHSHDPLPHYRPGEPVAYQVHVGAACHGAVLSLGRDHELPGSFEGEGSFTPASSGLWTIHLRRRDGLPLTPLSYLDADTGLPTYFGEFWVADEPVPLLGPHGLGPWHPTAQPIAPVP